MLENSYLDLQKVYVDLLKLLSYRHKSVEYLSQDDPFNLLISFIALASVVSSIYIQKVIENKYIRYPIVDEKSNLNVLDNFGVRPQPVIPSSMTITLEYVAGLLDSYVTIPYNTRFSVLDDTFVTFDNYYLLPNGNYAVVTAYKGEIREEEFGIADIVNQRIPLGYPNLVADKIKVTIDGTEYKYSDFCIYKKGFGIFGIEYEYDNTFYLTLPPNYTDYIFSNSRINVRYLTADSTINYDPTQEEVTLDSAIFTEDGESLWGQFEVYNIESFSYGDSRHTTDFCYKNLGKLLSTFGKAVTTEDYKILTDYYPGVAISAAYDIGSERRMDPFIYIQIPYYTKVVVAPTENYYPTEFLKNELYKYYDEVGVDRNQVYIQIIDPRYRLVDVNVLIHSKYLTPLEVLDSYNLIYESIKAFFRVGNLEFGSTITEDLLKSVVISADTKLLYSEDVEFEGYKTVRCEADELPILGRVAITFNYEKHVVSDIFAIGYAKNEEGEIIYDTYVDKKTGNIVEIPAEFFDRYYTLSREYPEPMATDDSHPGILSDNATYGPRMWDQIYISDTIYRDQELATDITIKRFTNVISTDAIEVSLSNSLVEDANWRNATEGLNMSDRINSLNNTNQPLINLEFRDNISVYRDGVEYRYICVTENTSFVG